MELKLKAPKIKSSFYLCKVYSWMNIFAMTLGSSINNIISLRRSRIALEWKMQRRLYSISWRSGDNAPSSEHFRCKLLNLLCMINVITKPGALETHLSSDWAYELHSEKIHSLPVTSENSVFCQCGERAAMTLRAPLISH